MSFKKLLAALIFISLLPLVSFAAIFVLEPEFLNRGDDAIGPDTHETGRTVAMRRNAKLENLTRTYRKRHPDGPLTKVDGKQLAPVEFMNRQLEREQASWRVSVKDGRVQFVEVT